MEGIEDRITKSCSAAAHFHLYYKKEKPKEREFKLLNASRRMDRLTVIQLMEVVQEVPNASGGRLQHFCFFLRPPGFLPPEGVFLLNLKLSKMEL